MGANDRAMQKRGWLAPLAQPSTTGWPPVLTLLKRGNIGTSSEKELLNPIPPHPEVVKANLFSLLTI
jgi:hypothetical protein